MVPLINSKANAQEAVSYCLYPPAGQRSVAGDIGCVGGWVGGWVQRGGAWVGGWLET
jgi:2-keto-3-deoxy-L-rhamnonate aldolase RhmA